MVLLMFMSAVTVRLLNWRTPSDVETRIADVGWPLLQWVRSMVATHIVRFFAGAPFRGSPIWTTDMTIGLGSVIEIGVQAGAGCQVGALSFVPKHCRLETGAIYAGIPAERIR